MSTALSQPTLDLQASPSVCDGRQFTQVDQAVLFGACSSKPPIAPAETCSPKQLSIGFGLG
ncbi:hypothetical protein C2W62_52500 [Candidatus Entotheonella serta]|nr:hypothetical protein C2W62_52500 [Candidatus Entotheonella serta]